MLLSHHFVSQHHCGNESWVASPEELLHARNLLHRQQHNERQQRAAELTGEDLVLAGADVVVEDDYEIRQLLEERGLPVAPAAAADGGSEVDSRSAAALRRRRRMVIMEANGDSPGAAKMSHSHPPCLLLTAISVLTYFLPSG